MTALRDAIDYTTLGWIKPELDETLRQARIEIEGFAEDPSDGSRTPAAQPCRQLAVASGSRGLKLTDKGARRSHPGRQYVGPIFPPGRTTR